MTRQQREVVNAFRRDLVTFVLIEWHYTGSAALLLTCGLEKLIRILAVPAVSIE